jgi:putative transposase
VTVAAFISSQRAEFDVPVTVACRALGVSPSWFYKWRDRPPTPRAERHAELVDAVWESFKDSGFTYGSPRVWLDLVEAGWRVSVNTVAAVMAEHGWAGRKQPRRRSLTRQGRRPAAADLVGRRFIASRPDELWCGDVTYVDTDEGWLYLASVLDLCSRRLLGYAMADAHDAGLTEAALRMAVTTRAGEGRPTRGVVFHSDRGSEGGLNRSSQHLDQEVVEDGCWSAAACGSPVSGADSVAGEADGCLA